MVVFEIKRDKRLVKSKKAGVTYNTCILERVFSCIISIWAYTFIEFKSLPIKYLKTVLTLNELPWIHMQKCPGFPDIFYHNK